MHHASQLARAQSRRGWWITFSDLPNSCRVVEDLLYSSLAPGESSVACFALLCCPPGAGSIHCIACGRFSCQCAAGPMLNFTKIQITHKQPRPVLRLFLNSAAPNVHWIFIDRAVVMDSSRPPREIPAGTCNCNLSDISRSDIPLECQFTQLFQPRVNLAPALKALLKVNRAISF